MQTEHAATHVPTQRRAEHAHAATLQHCLMIRQKIEQLTERLNASAVQMYAVVEREYQAGRLTLDDLAELYTDAQRLGPGFSGVWTQHLSVSAGKIRDYARRCPSHTNGAVAYWTGPYPYDGSRRPVKGTPVVYVLYDATNEPIYLGSTADFSARMRAHRRDGKPVAWWLAYPCESREAAYLLEGGLLAARKPPLNVKVGR